MTRAGFVFALFMLASCGDSNGPPVVVNNVVVTAAARDMPMAAAYLDISNRSGAALRITSVTSPNYESVEMHETRIEDGIARMRKLDAIEIADNETVSFVKGGRHLMLMRPLDEANDITLNFYQQDVLVVSVSAGFTRPLE